MPKSFFVENELSGDGDKLFASEFLAGNKKELGKHFTITDIVAARSGKGYMVHTEYFICWLWKKSKLTGMLLEALKEYSNTSHGYYLFAELTNANKDCFSIGVDTDVPTRWYDLGNGSYSTTQGTISSTTDTNPFLPHALSTSIQGETENPNTDSPPNRSRKRA